MAKVTILEVDKARYQFTVLDTTPALDLYDDLRFSIGDAFRKAIEGGGDEQAMELRLVGALVTSIPRGMTKKLGQIFADRTKVSMIPEGSTIEQIWVPLQGDFYEQHFADPEAGRGIGHWQKWILACLRYQYADFLGSLLSGKKPSESEQSGQTQNAGSGK